MCLRLLGFEQEDMANRVNDLVSECVLHRAMNKPLQVADAVTEPAGNAMCKKSSWALATTSKHPVALA